VGEDADVVEASVYAEGGEEEGEEGAWVG